VIDTNTATALHSSSSGEFGALILVFEWFSFGTQLENWPVRYRWISSFVVRLNLRAHFLSTGAPLNSF